MISVLYVRFDVKKLKTKKIVVIGNPTTKQQQQ